MDLEPAEIAFVDEYIKNGFKAGKAYKKVRPDVTQGSAYELGSRLLRKVETSDYYKSRMEELTMSGGEVIKRLTDLGRKNNLRALELLGKAHKLFVVPIEGNVNHSISWTDFISTTENPDAKSDS